MATPLTSNRLVLTPTGTQVTNVTRALPPGEYNLRRASVPSGATDSILSIR